MNKTEMLHPWVLEIMTKEKKMCLVEIDDLSKLAMSPVFYGNSHGVVLVQRWLNIT